MLRWLLIPGLLLIIYLVSAPAVDNNVSHQPQNPDMNNTGHPSAPTAPRRSHRFSHHGIEIEDHYAWLRDPDYPTVDDPDILAYLNAENAYFEHHMAPLKPLVDTIFAEMKGRQPEEDYSVPYLKNGFWYQWRYARHAQYKTWYRAPADNPQDWQVLLDEAKLADGREYFRLGALAVSPCGNKLAYSEDVDGSERYTLHVIDINNREMLTRPIPDTLGNPVWDQAGGQLLYVVVSEQWRPYKVFLRDVTQADKPDPLIYHETDGGFFVGLRLSQSEALVLIESGSHTSNETYFVPRENFQTPPRQVAPRQQDHEYHVDHGDQGLVIRSNQRHANFDIFTTSLDKLSPDHWQLWVAGDKTHYITDFLILKQHLIVEERVEGLDQIRVVTGQAQHYINFPETTYEVGLGTNPNFDTHTIRISYTSMVTPHTVFDYDLNSRALDTLKVTVIPSGYNPREFLTRRLQAPGRDGSKIPISLVYHKDTPINGSAPLYLYGYGAYGHAIPPSFSPSRISLLERGFIYAIAHIRGGDDLGYHWYTQGKLMQRTNTFNDFVDVAKYLIEENFAAAGNIAIAGGSAGGELMGAVVNQAPQLWGAVAAHVPFVDVLNTILDESLPLTPIEWDEWGNPIRDPKVFDYIRSYSPYDQLKAGAYPPMLVTAGLNDPRVTYWEPAKYVAKLRHLKTDSNPLLLKTNMGAGHGGKSGRFDALAERAEEYAFLISALNADQNIAD